MSTDLLQQLLDDFVAGTITAEQRQLLWQLAEDPATSSTVQAILLEQLQSGRYDMEDHPELHQRLMQGLNSRINAEASKVEHKPRIRFLRRDFFRYAAALVVLAGATIIAVMYAERKGHPPSIQQITDIGPGGDKAILTLADGRQIALDSAANGDLADQGGVQVVKLDSGQIAYDLRGSGSRDVMWNTISTPKGGQYRVTLPDGTKVWLNAASSIRFPTAFVASQRQVTVTGEVYVEVAQDGSKPFVIDVNGQSTVQVLGTIFNVNAYADDGFIKTTLIEGSVRINHQIILKPGQQALQHSNNTTLKIINHADMDQTLAWKNGLFNFNGMPLRGVMSQLERWYDIEVRYAGEVDNIIFDGKMYRNANLSDVLEVMNKMGGIQCKLDGKTVTVSK